MGRRCRMTGKALGIAEIVRNIHKVERIEQLECGVLAALQINRDQRAVARHLTSRQFSLRKALQTGMTNHQRLSPEERSSLGISDGVVRISIGLEDPQDLLEDLDRALDNI